MGKQGAAGHLAVLDHQDRRDHLGETGGDAVSMSWLGRNHAGRDRPGLSDRHGDLRRGVRACRVAQIRATLPPGPVLVRDHRQHHGRHHPLADYVTRSLGIGYTGGSGLLLAMVLGSLWLWHRTLGTVSVDSVGDPKSEAFYWLTIMCSPTLGTALGDWVADTAGLAIPAAC